ncbi:hypothetical protein PAPYR_8795 [Paratrimastix pyriformis]|uniref:Uncharacterized protein n=1 Tax=Paratrimastix pyriformis TaxID=342808 RepID=A0ABQ8UE08_9EUKA|nr:hypothetical protein PAPYR_8795 [Paratrimastix pyriformis]
MGLQNWDILRDIYNEKLRVEWRPPPSSPGAAPYASSKPTSEPTPTTTWPSAHLRTAPSLHSISSSFPALPLHLTFHTCPINGPTHDDSHAITRSTPGHSNPAPLLNLRSASPQLVPWPLLRSHRPDPPPPVFILLHPPHSPTLPCNSTITGRCFHPHVILHAGSFPAALPLPLIPNRTTSTPETTLFNPISLLIPSNQIPPLIPTLIV